MPNPLSGTSFIFGMSDMQFRKAQMRAVNAKKQTDWESVRTADVGILQTTSVPPLFAAGLPQLSFT
jgi:hypothetical protein